MNRRGRARASALAAVASLAVLATPSAQRGPGGDGVMRSEPTLAPLQDGLSDLPRGPGSIHGYVQDRDGGAPIGGTLLQFTLYPVVAGQYSAQPSGHRTVRVDDHGFYRLDSVSYGRYLLAVSSPGYSDSDGLFGVNSGSAAIVLSAAQPSAVHSLRLSKVASFDGVVRTMSGAPVAGVLVQPFRRVYNTHFMMWNLPVTATTGPDGTYRFTNVPPGEYTTCVTARTITMPTSVTDGYRAIVGTPDEATWVARFGDSDAPLPRGLSPGRFLHLGADDVWLVDAQRSVSAPRLSAAGTVEVPGPACLSNARDVTAAKLQLVRPGASVHGLDITLDPQSGVRLGGHLVGPPDQVGRVGLHLRRVGNEAILHTLGFDESQTVTDDDGRFAFLGVSPGRYAIHVEISPYPTVPGMTWRSGLPYGPDGRFLNRELKAWAAAEVEVRSEAIQDVTVTLFPTRSVSGQVVFAHDAVRSSSGDPEPLRVGWSGLDGRGTSAVQATVTNGRLSITGEAGGRFLLNGPSSSHWMVRSMTVNGRDILDQPIDLSPGDLRDVIVTMTDRLTAIEGVVRLPSGESAVDADVLIFPADSAGWFARSIPMHQAARLRADADGRYQVSGLPTGDYIAVALPPGGADDWPDERFVADAAASPYAKRFTLDSGPVATQRLVAFPILRR